MDNQDIDRLLEQGLSGDPPRQVFRAAVLMDSTEAFRRARRGAGWRLAALSAAAVLIGGVSFLVGRYSAPHTVANPTTVNASDTVTVSRDLVACLSAARLFKQLHMEDRMNRALDCAGRLLPREAIATGSAAGPMLAAGVEGFESPSRYGGSSPKPGSPQSAENVNRILAGYLGGYYHESGVD
jgi:hypothetical protein